MKLSKQREAKLDSYFEPKLEFYYPQDERDFFLDLENLFRKTFSDLENLYRGKKEKLVVESVGNGKGEYVESDNLIAFFLDHM